MAFPTNANLVQSFAGAMYGIQIGSVTMAQVNTDIVAAGGLSKALNGYYAASFGGVATATVASTVAANLGLTGDALNEGKAYITAQLNAAAPAARGEVIANILNLFAGLASDAKFGAAATAWNTKVDAAAAYTAAANVAIGTVVASAASLFTLTSGTDSFTGTSQNDTFDAQLNSSGNQTYSASDTVIGGAGTDTLNANITVAGQGTFVPAAAAMSGIEILNVSGAGAAVFNLTNVAELTSLVNNANTNSVTFTNTAPTVPVTVANTAGATVVNLKTNTLTGTTDALTVNLQGATGNITIADVTLSATDTSALEVLNLVTSNTSSTVNTLTVTTSGVSTINVSGDQDLTITTLTDATTAGVAAKTINASTLTGSLTVTGPHNTLAEAGNTITGGSGNDALTGGAGNDVISGGNGNDTIVIGTGNDSVSGGAGNDSFTVTTSLTSSDTIDGGDGTDTLTTTGAITGTVGSKVTNVETIAVAAAVEVDVSTLSGVTTVRSTSTAAGTTTFSGLAGTETLSLRSATAAVATVVTATKALDTSADTLNVTIGNSTGAAAVVVNTLNANDAETINITSSLVANTISALTSTDATKATVTSSVGLTISAFTGSSALKTIDASASTAAFIMGAAIGTSGVTLTGGSGADSLIGSAGNDVISAGDGADVISIGGGGGNDSLVGGAGNDTFFSVNALTSDITANDTIAGGDGTDSIQFGDTAVAGQAAYDLTASGILGNVSGIERIVLQDGTQAVTLTVGDDIVGIAGNALTVVANQTGRAATIVNNTLASTSTVTTTQNVAGQVLTYTVGNSIDKVTGNTAADQFIVATNAYISANDVIKGGSGADVMTFSAAAAGTFTAAQLAGISSVETFTVDTAAGSEAYRFTLNDTVVGNNFSGTSFTVSRAAETGTLNVQGQLVSYAMILSGGTGADTLIGGTGNDTITGGATGSDSLTGGAGNDTFVSNTVAAASLDRITDFDFGTSSTAVDVLDLDAALATADMQGANGALTISTTLAVTNDVTVFDSATFTLADLDVAYEALVNLTAAGESQIAIWQDTLGLVHVSVVTGSNGAAPGTDGGDEYSITDHFTLSGVTVVGVASLISSGDFAVGDA